MNPFLINHKKRIFGLQHVRYYPAKMSQVFTSQQIMDFVNNNDVIIEVSINDSERVPLRIRIPEEREEDTSPESPGRCSPPLKKRRTTLTPVQETLDEEDSPKPKMARQTMCPWFTNFLLFGFTVAIGCMWHEHLA